MNIIDGFMFQARHQPTAPAVCAPGTPFNVVSYGRLQAFAHNIARNALSAGLQPGDTVAVLAADPIFHLALILGLTHIGVITVSGGQALPPDIRVDTLISEDARPAFSAERVLVVDHDWVGGDGHPPRITHARRADDMEAFARIVLTSGTTGLPKAVGLTHANLIQRLQAYDVVFGNRFPACARTFLDVGLSTSFGYALTMHILSRGGTVFYRGTDPAETMQAFGLYKVQAMVASPSGAAEFLSYYEQSPAFECPFEVVLASGSLLSRSLSERLRARMCTNLMATYAATEISPVAAAVAHRIAHIKGAVGYVAPWIAIEAVDEQDRPLPPHTEGLIRMRGHTLVNGYLGNPEGSDRIFRHGWFYPGDIGTVTEDRLLIISGREDAVINLGGDKVNPETIEAVLMSYPGVIHAAAFAVADDMGVNQVWAAVESRSDFEEAAVRAHCARGLAPAFVPARIVRVAAMPRNAMGRIERDRLVELIPRS